MLFLPDEEGGLYYDQIKPTHELLLHGHHLLFYLYKGYQITETQSGLI